MSVRGHDAHDREWHRSRSNGFADDGRILAETAPVGVADHCYRSVVSGRECSAQEGPSPHCSIIIAGREQREDRHALAVVSDRDKIVACAAQRICDGEILPKPLEEGIRKRRFAAFPHGDDM